MFFPTCHGASLTPASSPPIILPSSKQKIEQGNIKINRNFHMIFYVLVNKSYATVNIPLKYVAHQLIDRKIRFMSIRVVIKYMISKLLTYTIRKQINLIF